MRKSLHIFTLALVILATATVALADAAPSGSVQATGVVNINTADAAQLALLPRVGEKAAQRILEYRTQHGSFKKTSELMQVKGFGAKTYERVAPYIAVEGKTTLSSKIQSPRKPRAKKPSTTASN
ncbi:MAG TPA: helix-hairpin-helix domain-containing protein [Thermoanaerobaculia bacterium]|nr:helix-hairpin-helix domain-containing protein [Thermoanaerobaculia bacterium]